MNNTDIRQFKKSIAEVGRLLWDKDLVSGLNGNISARVDEKRLVLTATQTCLGMLKETDVLLMKTTGEILEEGQVSTEGLLHTSIYQNFPDIRAVIQTVSLMTGNSFIVDPRVQGKITFISHTPMAPNELYHAFLSMLQLLNFYILTRAV